MMANKSGDSLAGHDFPLIDFGRFYTKITSQRKAVAAELDKALQDVGFVYLKNHGVACDEVERAFRWSQRFFDLPEEVKMLAPHPPGGSHHRGYSGMGLEKVSQNVYDTASIQELREVPDVKESFESGNTTDTQQPNIWIPDEKLPGFRQAMENFFQACDKMVHTLLECMAVALEMEDEKTLSKAHAASAFQLRLLHYPPVPVGTLTSNKAARIGAHSDFGSITLLFQDDVGGLEVENPKKPSSFKPAPPIEGTLLVNNGDLMERWSNGRWRSTVHRVVAPSAELLRKAGALEKNDTGEEMCKARYSIPFFSAPDADAVIDALPGCYGDDNPKKFEPVTTAEYIGMRMAALYSS